MVQNRLNIVVFVAIIVIVGTVLVAMFSYRSSTGAVFAGSLETKYTLENEAGLDAVSVPQDGHLLDWASEGVVRIERKEDCIRLADPAKIVCLSWRK